MNDWFQTLFRLRFLPAYIPILMSVMTSDQTDKASKMIICQAFDYIRDYMYSLYMDIYK
jgi:hypothetical protein